MNVYLGDGFYWPLMYKIPKTYASVWLKCCDDVYGIGMVKKTKRLKLYSLGRQNGANTHFTLYLSNALTESNNFQFMTNSAM